MSQDINPHRFSGFPLGGDHLSARKGAIPPGSGDSSVGRLPGFEGRVPLGTPLKGAGGGFLGGEAIKGLLKEVLPGGERLNRIFTSAIGRGAGSVNLSVNLVDTIKGDALKELYRLVNLGGGGARGGGESGPSLPYRSLEGVGVTQPLPAGFNNQISNQIISEVSIKGGYLSGRAQPLTSSLFGIISNIISKDLTALLSRALPQIMSDSIVSTLGKPLTQIIANPSALQSASGRAALESGLRGAGTKVDGAITRSISVFIERELPGAIRRSIPLALESTLKSTPNGGGPGGKGGGRSGGVERAAHFGGGTSGMKAETGASTGTGDQRGIIGGGPGGGGGSGVRSEAGTVGTLLTLPGRSPGAGTLKGATFTDRLSSLLARDLQSLFSRELSVELASGLKGGSSAIHGRGGAGDLAAIAREIGALILGASPAGAAGSAQISGIHIERSIGLELLQTLQRVLPSLISEGLSGAPRVTGGAGTEEFLASGNLGGKRGLSADGRAPGGGGGVRHHDMAATLVKGTMAEYLGTAASARQVAMERLLLEEVISMGSLLSGAQRGQGGEEGRGQIKDSTIPYFIPYSDDDMRRMENQRRRLNSNSILYMRYMAILKFLSRYFPHYVKRFLESIEGALLFSDKGRGGNKGRRGGKRGGASSESRTGGSRTGGSRAGGSRAGAHGGPFIDIDVEIEDSVTVEGKRGRRVKVRTTGGAYGSGGEAPSGEDGEYYSDTIEVVGEFVEEVPNETLEGGKDGESSSPEGGTLRGDDAVITLIELAGGLFIMPGSEEGSEGWEESA